MTPHEAEQEIARLKDEYRKVAAMLLGEIRRTAMLQRARLGDHGLDHQWIRRILAEQAKPAPQGIPMYAAEQLIIAWAVGDIQTLQEWWSNMLEKAEAENQAMEMADQ
jgi:hypothetical protein